MKKDRGFAKVLCSKKGERWLKGHDWLFFSDVYEINGEAKDGDIVDVLSEKGKYLGSGFYHSLSKIAVRLFSDNASDTYDEVFWRRRISYALAYRLAVMQDLSGFRVIFGDSDGFPGLTVDRFENLLVCECLCTGMERIKNIIYPALIEEMEKNGFQIDGLYERNESPIRKLEGLDTYKGWYFRKDDMVSVLTQISENGVLYEVDVENGQKTGFFLDQKYNRLQVGKLAKGKRVLDCFTHTGSFALNCALGGAASVEAVDISSMAIAQAKKNAALNGIDNIHFEVKDVFDYLPELIQKGGHPYDLIILDPPAFTKSRKTIGNAEKGYREINKRAMKLLGRGGYLATASCSHFMSHALFEQMLKDAAKETGVSLRLISVSSQSVDHPIQFGKEESDYLKFYIFQII